jgi:translation initiation factor IF-2
MSNQEDLRKKEIQQLFDGFPKPERKLEVVLKTDSAGTQEALVSAVKAFHLSEVAIEVIHADIGHVSKSDLFLAQTAGRLVVGLNVDILPKIKELAKEYQVEVRLYDVIYKLLNDLKEIAESLALPKEKERLIGKAKVIALFPGSRRGVILGCQVFEGKLALRQKFRLISAPGTVYAGIIGSLQIERDPVKEAKAGQQVGLKIEDFKRAQIGDLVESFEVERSKRRMRWQAKGGVFGYLG